MEMMFKGELDRGKIMKRLDGFLTLEIDRKLFALPLKLSLFSSYLPRVRKKSKVLL